ncbi:MAG TPA: tripartite tricarboxylate transporter TctB family protein [Burkholderiales bacterium]|nr:tripartite tricarboxylate transporter TctB family protein [Burkholderiales bacterium]
MRISGPAIFSLSLAAVAAYAVVAALAWPLKAGLFPLVMGIPLLALALVQLGLDLRDAGGPAEAAPEGSRGRSAIARRRTLATFAWMGAFIVLVLLLGFPIAVPFFVFCYLRMQSRAGWSLSIALAAAAWGFFHVVFERLLHFPFEAGLLLIGGGS